MQQYGMSFLHRTSEIMGHKLLVVLFSEYSYLEFACLVLQTDVWSCLMKCPILLPNLKQIQVVETNSICFKYLKKVC